MKELISFYSYPTALQKFDNAHYYNREHLSIQNETSSSPKYSGLHIFKGAAAKQNI